ncbi:AAA domain-containing protein [Clostridiales Family XIII bacterium WCA-MUC-591-APC-3H]|uniref:AAA domain-containing protein n=2 Tax=Hornefia butyriciproducens TaxID=2652293 RepID=A0A6L5Y7V6_9FIRM|nr:AAA domain-containing protein [Hornefia butyriciproducens]
MADRFEKNMILYGPPGTGKTYNSVIFAVAICDNRHLKDVQEEEYSHVLNRYKELRSEGRIAFTTFHQSYGYEEFIEGIKPIMDEEKEEIAYSIEDGIFKRFCSTAAEVEVKSKSFEIRPDASIWKITIKSGSKNNVKEECFLEGNMRIGFDIDSEDTSVKEFVEDMKPGDNVLSFKTREMIDGIGIIGEGDPEELANKTEYKVSRPVQWIATDIEENIISINEGKKLHRPTVARVPRMAVEDIMAVASKNNASLTETKIEKNTKPYVFIIDEINRGNISKIFGELITLIETTKRKGADEVMSATLPYSQSSFSVPDNVYILGTMNTADRSIALMDTALRRRFDFVEMMPESRVLTAIGSDKIELGEETLDVAEMLDKINARIEYLFDREHTIGHAFFTSLKTDPTIDNLADIFLKNVIPLLQEYFYEDYSKIQLILGDNGKEDEQYKFIKDSQIIMKDLFRGSPDLDLGDTKYEINLTAFYKIQSYQQI